MSALDDDPYLAELLDLTNDELGDGGTNGSKKAGAAAAAATSTSTSQASASASSAGAAAAAAAASSSSQASPAKAPSYRSSGACVDLAYHMPLTLRN